MIDESIESVRGEFYIEAREILEKASEDTLKAEEHPEDAKYLNGVFRGIHTIKGGAGMFAMMDVSEFAHKLEGVLNVLRDRELEFSSELVDIVLGGIDHIIQMIGDYEAGKEAKTDQNLLDMFAFHVEQAKSPEKKLEKKLEKEAAEEITTEAEEKFESVITSPRVAQTMRINEKKIEQFTNIVGEMMIARNTYEYLITHFEGLNGEAESIFKLLKENLHLFSRLTNEIQHSVMSLRMVPIGGVFQRFNRIVRDISTKQAKPIELVLEGGDIEIDKKIGDTLFDPMVHLVRNSCDHGIEMPDVRLKSGKPEKGKVILRASQEGSNLRIEIIDDGKGISREEIFKKAIQKGFEFSSPDDPGLLDVIFMPGFSTKSEVTDLSGRGVGMDVVKTSIESLSGAVSIKFDEGKGSEVLLNIPMTMGVNEVLVVECAGDTYAIPFGYIIESMKIPSYRLRNATDRMIFHYRGEVLAVEWLENILGLSREKDFNKDEFALVIIKTRLEKFGLVVDQFTKNMEVAIKPLPDEFSDISVISGVSIMGNGKVFLVLNPEKFF